MLYITKNALTAYTIAIVQNAQALQYDQMHLALQTARNQASLETLLRADDLLTAHFNLAVLSNETDITKTSDAQKPILLMQNRQPQLQMRRPTLRYPVAVMLQIVTQRSNTLLEQLPQLVEKSTDSWDNDSHTHEHTHTHNIVPLLSIRPWNNRPHRGREQPHGQHNNINVRTGHAPYSRPLDNQLYGRCTCSQQALCVRTYRKIQHRYPIQ